MTLAQRIQERIEALDLTQSELARRAQVPQTTINSLVRGKRRSTPHLTRLARELQTTPAYLMGEIDDPDEGAPPPLPLQNPKIVHVMLPVALPAAPALTRMYQGLLRSLGDWQSMPEAELAHELATLLPTGLGVVRGPLRYEACDEADQSPERRTDQPIDDRERRRA